MFCRFFCFSYLILILSSWGTVSKCFLPCYHNNLSGFENLNIMDGNINFAQDIINERIKDIIHLESWQNDNMYLHEVRFPHEDFVKIMPEKNVFGWYFNQFNLPEDYIGKDVLIELGIIDDADETYINGKLIGKTGLVPNGSAWQEERLYRVSPKLLQKGINRIAVKVWSLWGSEYMDISILSGNTRQSLSLNDKFKLDNKAYPNEANSYIIMNADDSAMLYNMSFIKNRKKLLNGTIQLSSENNMLDGEESTFSENELRSFLDNYFKLNLSKLHSRLKISKIGTVHRTMEVKGVMKDIVTGYLVTYDICENDIPILWDTVRVKVEGKKIVNMTIRNHQIDQTKTIGEKVKLLNSEQAWEKNREIIVKYYNFTKEDKFSSIRLVYGNESALEFIKIAGVDKPERFIPMWEFRIVRSDSSCAKEVILFINAITGELYQTSK